MKFTNYYRALQVFSLLGVFSFVPVAVASDADDLTAMLHEFLGAADKEAAHRRFWADDLVYTSSNGTRTNKAEILEGFRDVQSSDASPAIVYSGEDIDVRVYNTTAVVAFKLLAKPSDGSDVAFYFNTGTFLKRDGAWKVVAWQATKIPPAQDIVD